MRTLALLIALVTASAAVASVTHARHSDQDGHDIELIASVKKGFGIKGVPVTGLYPGATRPLKVTITNTYGFAIKVSAPTARVAFPSSDSASVISARARSWGDLRLRL